MQILLALIPLFAYLYIFIFLYNRFPADPVRRTLLEAAIVWGVYLAISLEVLSFFNGITSLGLLVIWLIPIVLVLVWYVLRRSRGQRTSMPRLLFPASWWDRLILLVICVVILATGLVAWLTPPQTWDSLTYHLSRVAHWAQDRSIWHYATGIDRQTSMPPGAEEQVLDFYVLTQGDRLSNFPEWLAMLGSVMGVSLIAYYLGGKSSGQWVAAGFAATLPVGIVAASSTINDYVAAFWVVCVVVECLAYYKTGEKRALLFTCMAAGMALLTKPVSVPFMLPFALWLGYMIIKRHGFLTVLKWGVVAVVVVGVINVGYLARNVITYGGLSNPVDFENHYNQLHTVQGFLATTLKNAGVHLGLPGLAEVNRAWYLLILKIIVKLGLDINDPRMTAVGYFQVVPPSTHEAVATNPYHAYLIFALLVSLFFVARKHGKSLLTYALLAVATFLLFSLIYKWNTFGTRYDLAFFVLFAPAAGVILAGFDKLKLGHLVVVLLFVGSLPWLFSIYERPLIPAAAGKSEQTSVLTADRQDLYFTNAPSERDVYTQYADIIKDKGCKDVGVMLEGDDPEYLLWELLGAPTSGTRLEWIVSGPTSMYSNRDFQACAIICRGCTAQQSPLRGLEIAYSTGDFSLYLPAGGK